MKKFHFLLYLKIYKNAIVREYQVDWESSPVYDMEKDLFQIKTKQTKDLFQYFLDFYLL